MIRLKEVDGSNNGNIGPKKSSKNSFLPYWKGLLNFKDVSNSLYNRKFYYIDIINSWNTVISMNLTNLLFILAKNSKILGQKCCLDHSSVDGNGNRKFLCGKIPFVWTRKGRKEPLDWRLVMFFRQFLHQFFPRTFRTQTLRKGQFISKCLFSCHHFDQNSNENIVRISALNFL